MNIAAADAGGERDGCCFARGACRSCPAASASARRRRLPRMSSPIFFDIERGMGRIAYQLAAAGRRAGRRAATRVGETRKMAWCHGMVPSSNIACPARRRGQAGDGLARPTLQPTRPSKSSSMKHFACMSRDGLIYKRSAPRHRSSTRFNGTGAA